MAAPGTIAFSKLFFLHMFILVLSISIFQTNLSGSLPDLGCSPSDYVKLDCGRDPEHLQVPVSTWWMPICEYSPALWKPNKPVVVQWQNRPVAGCTCARFALSALH